MCAKQHFAVKCFPILCSAHLFNVSILKALEPSDRKVIINVTRWFTTCINQPQFLAVLGEIPLCERAVSVTPKTNAAAKTKTAQTTPVVDSAADAANGKKVLRKKSQVFVLNCVHESSSSTTARDKVVAMSLL